MTGLLSLLNCLGNLFCRQSYKASKILIYEYRVVNIRNLIVITTVEQ